LQCNFSPATAAPLRLRHAEPAAQLSVRSVSQTLGSAVLRAGWWRAGCDRLKVKGCGASIHRTANRSFRPPASGATLEPFLPHRTERGRSRPFQSQLHGLNRGAVRAARAAPRFEAATRKQMRFGCRRSARRSSHGSHRWFTRLTRGGVHDARRTGQTCPESGVSRRKSTNTVKVLANKRQKLTRRGGVARRPSRLALPSMALPSTVARQKRRAA
jgi:hypothetical protein